MKANMKSGTTLRTPFWQAAYQSLPKTARQRYLAYIEHAERWDLALDGVIEALSRAKGAVASAAGLAAGSHTLRIEVTGTKNAASTDAIVAVDAFDVIQ